MRAIAPSVSRSFATDRLPLLALALALAGLLMAMRAGSAGALIQPAHTIDGPSQDIIGFGGAAMADDGTGGVVYLKRLDGITHVFVSRYYEGAWHAPIQVDSEDTYAASSPQIGAAEGGELIVVWATPFAVVGTHTAYELEGAELAPGSERFGPATVIDPDINEAAGASPALAVSSTGFAAVVYRVVSFSPTIPLLQPGDVQETVKAAVFDGERWSSLGTINRDSGLSMRPPTAANAPQIAIGPTGSGVIVWQEPEGSNKVARIWARRFFGSTLDYVMPVTATTFDGQEITQDADAPSAAISRLGQAIVAYRQRWAPGSPLPGPRIFTNTLPDGEAESGDEFLGATVADQSVPGGTAASLGRPSVDINEKRESRLIYDSDGMPQVVESNDKGVLTPLSLGPAFVGSSAQPASEVASASVMNPEGGGISAWPSANPRGQPEVAIREDFPSGAVQTGLVSGGAGGVIGELAVGRSGFGDGIVAFQQGPLGNAAIVAASVTAPPEHFVVTIPKGWVRPAAAALTWAPSESADGPITYHVVLDGRIDSPPIRYTATAVFGFTLPRAGLTTGTHEVQVLATDIFGQSLLTAPDSLKVDASPPSVHVSRGGGGHIVTVHLSDAGPGLALSSVRVSFGDGASAHGKRTLSHRYGRAGVYEVTVKARDALGLGVTRRLEVRVP